MLLFLNVFCVSTMSRKRALTQKELEEEMERIMQNLSDESSALEDDGKKHSLFRRSIA